MSSIASFYHLEVSKLAELREKAQIPPTIEKKFFSKNFVDPYWDYFEANSSEFADYNWSGYAIVLLVEYILEKKEVDLCNGEYKELADFISGQRENMTIIFSKADKEKFLNHLVRADFNNQELLEFNTEFAEIDDMEFTEAQLDGVDALKCSLESLNDDSKVVMITVG